MKKKLVLLGAFLLLAFGGSGCKALGDSVGTSLANSLNSR